jgi:hypothetical protein
MNCADLPRANQNGGGGVNSHDVRSPHTPNFQAQQITAVHSFITFTVLLSKEINMCVDDGNIANATNAATYYFDTLLTPFWDMTFV